MTQVLQGSSKNQDIAASYFETFSNFLTFTWQFICHPSAVGTPFSCSSAVAERILAFVPSPSDQIHHYLEVGPGTGAFTQRFIEKLGPNDSLDLVEIDQVFCEALQQQYGHLSNVHIHHLPIQEWKPSYQYDVVIAAVPLNALRSVDILSPILASYEKLTKAGGILSAVEYIGTSSLTNFILWGENQQSFQDMLTLKIDFFKKYSFITEQIWKNLPPARVFHCRITPLPVSADTICT